VLDIDKTEINF